MAGERPKSNPSTYPTAASPDPPYDKHGLDSTPALVEAADDGRVGNGAPSTTRQLPPEANVATGCAVPLVTAVSDLGAEATTKLANDDAAVLDTLAVDEAVDDVLDDDASLASTTEQTDKFVVCGIGASAGGLDAVSRMLRRVKLDNTAFVVVQHLDPNQESYLRETLAGVSSLRVVTALDGMTVERNYVYVVPPSAEVALLHGRLHLMTPPDDGSLRLPIDFFLRSLAADRGPEAIGVVMSGMGSDGTFGLKAVKAEGGITFAQDPTTAEQTSMPLSAIESGAVDFCLAPGAIGDELSHISHHPYLARRARAVRPTKNLAKIFVLIRNAFGTDLTHYKHPTLERRIERRMALQRVERVDDYVKYVHSNTAELAALYKDVLIGVTSFFRDKLPFEELKESVFPQILKTKKPGDAIRFWSAGCATGEEPYSIAMCLLEYLGDRAQDYRIQGFGTDIDIESVRHARRGVYAQNISLDVSRERLGRFFTKRESDYRVTRVVRDLLVFANQNIAKDAPFSRLDLVSCRNVLIYMQPLLQKNVLNILHYALNPEGYLMLGTSETVNDAPDDFMQVDRKNKLYVRGRGPTSVETQAVGASGSAEFRPREAEARPRLNVQQLADRKIAERFGPPGVLLNANLDVLQYRGRVGMFFDPAPGPATFNVLKNIRPELQGELRVLLHKAMRENVPVSSKGVRLGGRGDETRLVDLEVVPMQDAESKGRCWMLCFLNSDRSAPPADARVDAGGASAERVDELERALTSTKEYLQSVIEELETSNEELKSLNEELQSSNEELQSTNEELETSKEELQSSNEELTTVNDEIHHRMGELGQSNDDVQNVMSALESAVVIVGLDLRIRRFSHRSERLLNLVPDDIGRSVESLKRFMPGVNFEHLIADATTRQVTVETDALGVNGWYTVHVSPYKTSEQGFRGAIITFLAREHGDRPSEVASDVQNYANQAFAVIQLPLLVVGEEGRVLWANEPFYAERRVRADRVVGRLIADLVEGAPDDHIVRELLHRAFDAGDAFKDVPVFYREGPRDAARMSGGTLPSPTIGRNHKLVLIVFEAMTAHDGGP